MKKKAKKPTRREPGIIWVARDSETLGDDGESVHFHAKPPKIESEADSCPHCGETVGISYLAGLTSVCTSGFEKLTGIEIKPGTVVKIRVVVAE